MTRTAILVVSTALTALLAILCIQHHRPMIVEDLTSRSRDALQTAGIPIPVFGLTFDGRDATLRGPQGSAIVSDRTRDLVAALWGVRIVKVETTPLETTPGNTAAVVQQKVTEVLKFNNVEFETGSAKLTPVGRATLDKVAAELKLAPPSAPIGIHGHTDNRGKRQLNMRLSEDRADAAKSYLVSLGIDAARLTTQGFGPDQPTSSNETEAGRQQNRRIEFSVKEIVVEKKETR